MPRARLRYVGERVAERLLDGGACVHATTIDGAIRADLAARGAHVVGLDILDAGAAETLSRLLDPSGSGLRVLCAIPVRHAAAGERMAALLNALGSRAQRVVYLSSSGVYGPATHVDERTPPDPRDEAGRARLAVERAVREGPWSGLVLRPAAIYGPDRGLHAALRAGRLGRVRDPDRVVSRIHADDLAAIVEAALRSRVTGAFPLADDEPATPREVAAFCHGLGVPVLPALEPRSGESPARRGRKVEGGAVRRLLSVDLRYPSFRVGIAEALRGRG